MKGYKVVKKKRYDFVNEKTGERVTGCKITYHDEKIPSTNQNEQGYDSFEISTSYENYDLFPVVPGLYDIEFTMKPGKFNKPVLDLKNAKFIYEVEYQEIKK